MGSLSIWHWLIILLVGLLLLGGGNKLSNLMGDMAKGIKAFKKGMKEEDENDHDHSPAAPKTIDGQSTVTKEKDRTPV